MGAAASGVCSNWVPDSDATPPGFRKAGFREIAAVLLSSGHEGYHPSVATGSLLGFSVMAYQSADVLLDRCEGQGRILVRLAGACTRAHQGARRMTSRGGRRRATAHVVPALPMWPCPPVTRRASTPATRHAGCNCGGTVAPGRPVFSLLFFSRAIMEVPLPYGIGLTNLGSPRLPPCVAVILARNRWAPLRYPSRPRGNPPLAPPSLLFSLRAPCRLPKRKLPIAAVALRHGAALRITPTQHWRIYSHSAAHSAQLCPAVWRTSW